MRQAVYVFSAVVCLASGWAEGGIGDLANVVDRTSHRASSHDRSGGNDDSIPSFEPGATHVMLDTDGPGLVTHLWMTVAGFPEHYTFLRDLVLRMYWEGSEVPSVEVPVGDFFALGHGRTYPVRSMPIAVGISNKALNCYWPMPFHKHARIEICNNGLRSIRRIYYNVDYELGPIQAGQALFHASFNREKELRSQSHSGNVTGKDNYVILETEGRGQYVGCALFVDAQPGGWWGEGDEMIFIDHSERPAIIGTGSEDYFCNAWGYSESFSYPFYGAPLLEDRPDGGKVTTVYRWHVQDPVRFSKHIRVTIEHLCGPKTVNDYSSVAYWYQAEPIRSRRPLPRGEANHPTRHDAKPRPVDFKISATELEGELRARGAAARSMTDNLHAGFLIGGHLEVDTGGKDVELVIPVSEDGTYRVRVKPVHRLIEKPIRITLKGNDAKEAAKLDKHEREVPEIDLGTSRTQDKTLVITVGGNRIIGLDWLQVERVGD